MVLTSGRTRAAVEKDLREMLHARHLKGLARVTLTDSPTLALHHEVDQAAWTYRREMLGKNAPSRRWQLFLAALGSRRSRKSADAFKDN